MQEYQYSSIFEQEARTNKKMYTVQDKDGNVSVAALINFIPPLKENAVYEHDFVNERQEAWIRLPGIHVSEFLRVWVEDGDFEPTRVDVSPTEELYTSTVLGKYLADIVNAWPEPHPDRIMGGIGLDKNSSPFCDWFYTEETAKALEEIYLTNKIAIDQAKFSKVLSDMVPPNTTPRMFQVKSVHTVKDSRGYILYVIPTGPTQGATGTPGRLSGYIYNEDRGEITYTTVDEWRYSEVFADKVG